MTPLQIKTAQNTTLPLTLNLPFISLGGAGDVLLHENIQSG